MAYNLSNHSTCAEAEGSQCKVQCQPGEVMREKGGGGNREGGRRMEDGEEKEKICFPMAVS